MRRTSICQNHARIENLDSHLTLCLQHDDMSESRTLAGISPKAQNPLSVTSLRNFAVLSSLAEARGIQDLSLDQLIDYMQLPPSRLLPQEWQKRNCMWSFYYCYYHYRCYMLWLYDYCFGKSVIILAVIVIEWESTPITIILVMLEYLICMIYHCLCIIDFFLIMIHCFDHS